MLLVLSACKTIPVTPQSVLAALVPGKTISGTPIALGPAVTLNAEDFVYDAKLSPDSKHAAVSRLGMKSFHLALHDATTGKSLSDTAINALEFDVDALEFSPDGNTVATVSRDGALRLYDAATGALISQWLTEEPLVTLAWRSDGVLLALGSARGLVTLVSFPQLEHVAEFRAHTDEVRGLAFGAGGELISGSWDKRFVIFTVVDALTAPREVRTHFTRKNGLASFRAVIDRAASATLVLDTRAPVVVIKSALAQAVGIDALLLTETIQIPTAFGNQVAKLAKNRQLGVKNLTFTGVDVAICDACVPPDAQGVLGGPLLSKLQVAFDEANAEVLFTVNEGATGIALTTPRTLQPARSFTMPAPVNDFALDLSGTIAGVAFSETKSERTKAIYDREKKGELEPEREWDCAARVELATGKVLETKHGHRGVVATAAVSPDGKTLASGGWDKKIVLHGNPAAIDAASGWAVRRVRFSRDGRWLVTAAWTPQNPLGNHQSDPSARVFEVIYGADATVK
ncbi:MAG: WD40 repeat domain-containing protein [Archangium sp.]